MLKKLNISFDIADNGAVALELLKNNHAIYDLVLMDCEMPAMDGFSTTQKLRVFEQQNQLSRKPIIALTARAIKRG